MNTACQSTTFVDAQDIFFLKCKSESVLMELYSYIVAIFDVKWNSIYIN